MKETGSTEKRAVSAVRYLTAALIKAAAFTAAVYLIFTMVFGIETVSVNDMFPQIRAGDVAFYFRIDDPERMDAVIYDTGNGYSAGRIAASEGDTVGITDSGRITINGDLQPVQKRLGIFSDTEADKTGVHFPVTLEKDQFFILGDDRGSAEDSRMCGAVSRDDIKGVIFLIIRRRAV